jgi:hypothetical protein
MRKRDEVKGAAFAAHRESAPDDFFQFGEGDKLRDREFANWNDKVWPQEIDFVIHPRRAIPNFIRRGNAVTACGSFAGEAAADRGEVNLRAHLDLSPATKFLKPTE